MTYLTDSTQGTGFSTANKPIRPFSHVPQTSQFICHAKNVMCDVAYPMHVWRLFINFKYMHAKRVDLGAHCVPRGHTYLGTCYVDMRKKKKKEKKRRHRSLRNGRCRNVDEHAVEWIKTIMQLRGRFPSYRLRRSGVNYSFFFCTV